MAQTLTYLEKKIIGDIKRRISNTAKSMMALETQINTWAYSMSDDDMLYYQNDAISYVQAVDSLNILNKLMQDLICELESYNTEKGI